MVSSGLKLSLDNLLTYIDQKAALLDLIGQLKEEFPEAIIHGHNEFSAKACPCFDVKKELVPYFEKGGGGINKQGVRSLLDIENIKAWLQGGFSHHL